jgi:hypothetical protein
MITGIVLTARITGTVLAGTGIADTIALGTSALHAARGMEHGCLIGGFVCRTRRRDQRFARGSCRQVSPLQTANPVITLV